MEKWGGQEKGRKGKQSGENLPVNSSLIVDTLELRERSRELGVGFKSFGTLEVTSQGLEMPVFEGDNPYGWVFRAEMYFSVNQLMDVEKLNSMTLYFEGVALSWFQ